MNFREWLEQTLSKADPRLYGEKEDAMEAAWEASKAEERERIRFAIEQARLIIPGDPSDYALAWNEACDEILTLANWTGDDTEAEQIRKGE